MVGGDTDTKRLSHSTKVTLVTSSVSGLVRLESKESLPLKESPDKGSLPTKLLNTTDPAQISGAVLKEMKTFS